MKRHGGGAAAAAVEQVSAAPTVAPVVRLVSIDRVHESPLNPRKHFDQVKLEELAASIRSKGILQSLVVRPRRGADEDGPFEIIAGARRFRASKLAGLTELPVDVRQYGDQEALELMLIENLQRDDLTPLERAAAFQALIDSSEKAVDEGQAIAPVHTVQSIAAREGMSVDWVWDQLYLNKLVPEAKELLEQQLIGVKHAVMIGRLKAEDQVRVLEVRRDKHTGRVDSLLWESDSAGLPWDQDDPANKGRKAGKYDGLKQVSLRELEKNIQRHVRFDVTHAAQTQPLQFAPLAERVETAQAKPGRGRKVILISFETFVHPDAKEGLGDGRIYGPQTWRRADGTKGTTPVGYPVRWKDSPTCEHSVLGIVAVGLRRGESFDVCIAKEKCRTHYGDVIKAKEKAANGNVAGTKKNAREEKERKNRERAQQREQRTRKRWELLHASLTKAVTEALAKIPGQLPKPVYQRLLAAYELPTTTPPAKFQRALLSAVVDRAFRYAGSWAGHEPELVAWAKLLKVDTKKLEPSKADINKAIGGGDEADAVDESGEDE